MKAKLTAEIDNHVIISLDITKEAGPFVCKCYKGVKPDNPHGSRAVVIDRILDKIIELNEFVITPDLRDEIEYVFNGTVQGIKYQNMFGGPAAMTEIDYDEIRRNVEEDVTREYKIDLIVKSIVEQEKLTTTLEERRVRAEEIAKKDNTTIEMIQRFMGEDFALIEHDLLVEKVRNLVYENAVL